MLEKQFYPTPKELIIKLLKPYEYPENKQDRYSHYLGKYNINGNILEPSAGKGDIAKFINENSRNKKDISVIEIDSDLQLILKEDFPLIDSDFLNYKNDVFWDFIIMNPPFDKGDEHLLKAIEISYDTKIACILNAETIRNPYTEKRKKLLSLIEKYGTYEFVKDAFKNAERKTNVEVALVWLEIKSDEDMFEFDFINEKEIDINFDIDFENDSIAKQDLIGNMQIRYEEIRMAYREKLIADKKFNHYLSLLVKESWSRDSMTINEDEPKKQYSYLSTSLKKYMWEQVIDHLNIKKYMSYKVIANFDMFVKQQSNMSFTKENVFSFFDFIMMNRVNIIEQAIIDVFDNLTKHGYLKENRMFVETWKTNDAYKVNRRVIAPTYLSYGSYTSAADLKAYGDRFRINSRDELNDIDKVLAYIKGVDYDKINLISEVLSYHFDKLGNVKTGDKFKNTLESTFFNIKFYKKGTIHLYFKDKKLWEEFNIRATKGKNWLPNDEYRKWEEENKKEIVTELVIETNNNLENKNEQLKLEL